MTFLIRRKPCSSGQHDCSSIQLLTVVVPETGSSERFRQPLNSFEELFRQAPKVSRYLRCLHGVGVHSDPCTNLDPAVYVTYYS
jgi:hypothetical protein